ncbi:hypothetical protein BDW02DRAFT_593752 [Decorospora gaudefroyi]|uniref:Uncharacterized protein n=1 Tax=Decorospora gaudefroyi TaxID=184978 RepID=A0A6A5KQ89_9PLEO|nr:hypothetical protein BDW02DRAFT_593752 [Decorospora gaudefroyi]
MATQHTTSRLLSETSTGWRHIDNGFLVLFICFFLFIVALFSRDARAEATLYEIADGEWMDQTKKQLLEALRKEMKKAHSGCGVGREQQAGTYSQPPKEHHAQPVQAKKGMTEEYLTTALRPIVDQLRRLEEGQGAQQTKLEEVKLDSEAQDAKIKKHGEKVLKSVKIVVAKMLEERISAMPSAFDPSAVNDQMQDLVKQQHSGAEKLITMQQDIEAQEKNIEEQEQRFTSMLKNTVSAISAFDPSALKQKIQHLAKQQKTMATNLESLERERESGDLSSHGLERRMQTLFENNVSSIPKHHPVNLGPIKSRLDGLEKASRDASAESLEQKFLPLIDAKLDSMPKHQPVNLEPITSRLEALEQDKETEIMPVNMEPISNRLDALEAQQANQQTQVANLGEQVEEIVKSPLMHNNVSGQRMEQLAKGVHVNHASYIKLRENLKDGFGKCVELNNTVANLEAGHAGLGNTQHIVQNFVNEVYLARSRAGLKLGEVCMDSWGLDEQELEHFLRTTSGGPGTYEDLVYCALDNALARVTHLETHTGVLKTTDNGNSDGPTNGETGEGGEGEDEGQDKVEDEEELSDYSSLFSNTLDFSPPYSPARSIRSTPPRTQGGSQGSVDNQTPRAAPQEPILTTAEPDKVPTQNLEPPMNVQEHQAEDIPVATTEEESEDENDSLFNDVDSKASKKYVTAEEAPRKVAAKEETPKEAAVKMDNPTADTPKGKAPKPKISISHEASPPTPSQKSEDPVTKPEKGFEFTFSSTPMSFTKPTPFTFGTDATTPTSSFTFGPPTTPKEPLPSDAASPAPQKKNTPTSPFTFSPTPTPKEPLPSSATSPSPQPKNQNPQEPAKKSSSFTFSPAPTAKEPLPPSSATSPSPQSKKPKPQKPAKKSPSNVFHNFHSKPSPTSSTPPLKSPISFTNSPTEVPSFLSFPYGAPSTPNTPTTSFTFEAGTSRSRDAGSGDMQSGNAQLDNTSDAGMPTAGSFRIPADTSEEEQEHGLESELVDEKADSDSGGE